MVTGWLAVCDCFQRLDLTRRGRVFTACRHTNNASSVDTMVATGAAILKPLTPLAFMPTPYQTATYLPIILNHLLDLLDLCNMHPVRPHVMAGRVIICQVRICRLCTQLRSRPTCDNWYKFEQQTGSICCALLYITGLALELEIYFL